jgi:mannose-6-phosphate isomerase-like protein (cupin superfamily)
MAEIKMFKSYEGAGKVVKPATPVQPNIVTVRDGCPVKYPGCEGIGVRVVHPSNPKAPAKNFGMVVFIVPPHVILPPGSHENEECYYILRGEGTMTLAGKKVEVREGTFIHLPSWCEHGVENTGDVALEILICTSPPNP